MTRTRVKTMPKREGKVSLQKQNALERFRDLKVRLLPKGRHAAMASEEDAFKAIS